MARTGKDGLFLALSEGFDVIVTGRMLPAPDGLAIVRALRASAVMMPIPVLTALDDVERRVERLDAGADDYLAKPFAFSELMQDCALSRRPSFLKKRSKRTFGPAVALVLPARAQGNKSFLVLFFKKEPLALPPHPRRCSLNQTGRRLRAV